MAGEGRMVGVAGRPAMPVAVPWVTGRGGSLVEVEVVVVVEEGIATTTATATATEAGAAPGLGLGLGQASI